MDDLIQLNKENINEFNKFIDENRDNIRLILASIETHMLLSNNMSLPEGKHFQYKGIRVIIDPYYVFNNVGFILKSDEVKFDFNINLLTK